MTKEDCCWSYEMVCIISASSIALNVKRIIYRTLFRLCGPVNFFFYLQWKNTYYKTSSHICAPSFGFSEHKSGSTGSYPKFYLELKQYSMVLETFFGVKNPLSSYKLFCCWTFGLRTTAYEELGLIVLLSGRVSCHLISVRFIRNFSLIWHLSGEMTLFLTAEKWDLTLISIKSGLKIYVQMLTMLVVCGTA